MKTREAFHIRNVRREQENTDAGAFARLAARITAGDESGSCRETELWFRVREPYGRYLTDSQADAFAVSLLYTAACTGRDILSDVPVSGRLLYQLNEYMLPSLAGMLGKEPVRVRAPAAREPLPCEGAVGTGYSGGVDSFFTISQHTGMALQDAPWRPALTHILVINAGVYEGPDARVVFENACRDAEEAGAALGLKAVGIDTNLHPALKECYLSVSSFRLCAAVLSMQGLFGTYLLSSGNTHEYFRLAQKDIASVDLLTCGMLSTETLRFTGFGGGTPRIEKIRALTEYAPCYTRLHPCFVNPVTEMNCGHCKKCRRDTVSLWAMGALDRFSAVYDVKRAERERTVSIAFLLANSGVGFYREALDEMERAGIAVPARSRILAEQFRRSMSYLEKKDESDETDSDQAPGS